ncbi:MAG TPA: dihydrofolate reductase family protein [Nocardioidaceae bacterium]
MVSTTYLTATSLDGYIATEDNDLSWLFQLEGEEPVGPYDEFIVGVGAMAMGSTTYEWVLDHENGRWPYDLPTWVFSHRDLPVPEGSRVEVTADDVTTVHARMLEAAAGRNLWLVGGGDLVGQFLDRDLLDDIWVSITPILLGRGAPLLPRRHTRPMRVMEVRHAEGDPFVHVHYSLH